MITFIAFILTIAGCINWLMIGMLQYDYIAGLFGFQASIFSRIIYIIFGFASLYLIVRTIVNKGTFKIWESKKRKKKPKKLSDRTLKSDLQISNSKNKLENDSQKEVENLFDDHLNDK